MASRFVHRLLLRPVWERCKNTKLLANCSQSLSTNSLLLSQSQLEVQLKKEANDNNITQWKLCAAVCLVSCGIKSKTNLFHFFVKSSCNS